MNVALHSDRAGRSAPVGLRCLSICAGGGGLDLGFELAFPGARAVAYVEREAFAAGHLVAAMRAGLVAPAPVWSDARTLDGRAWRGGVDCVIGGIPCQPHSVAGKRLGRDDERDLWGAFRRIIVQSGAWLAALAGAPQLEPAIRRVADGLAAGLDATRVDELRMLGNGVCPLAAGHAFRALWSAHAARLGAGADEPFRGVSDGL